MLYIAQVYPHTRGVKWVQRFHSAGLEPLVAYGRAGKDVWKPSEAAGVFHVPRLARKFDSNARRAAGEVLQSLGGYNDDIRAVIVRDIFLGRVGRRLSMQLGVPWYLDLCDNYPEVVSLRVQGSRSWRSVAPWVVGAIERHAVRTADCTIFVSKESQDHVLKKWALDERKRRGRRDPPSFVVENAPIVMESPQLPPTDDGRGLVYIGTFDDKIRDLQTVVKGLRILEARFGRSETVTLLTFDQSAAIASLDNLGGDWRRFVRFERPVAASVLPTKLRAFAVGLVPHGSGPAVDYTLSNKIFDYLYAGIPVLASDNPPNVRLLDDVGGGMCYRRHDPEDFASVLNLLLSERSMGRASVLTSRLYPKYSWAGQSDAFVNWMLAELKGDE